MATIITIISNILFLPPVLSAYVLKECWEFRRTLKNKIAGWGGEVLRHFNIGLCTYLHITLNLSLEPIARLIAFSIFKRSFLYKHVIRSGTILNVLFLTPVQKVKSSTGKEVSTKLTQPAIAP